MEEFECRSAVGMAEAEHRCSWDRIVLVATTYEADCDLLRCLRCGSQKFWFDGGGSDEWRNCFPQFVENLIRLELTSEFVSERQSQFLTRHSRNQTGKSVTMPEWASNF
jgi:hypothetical protein